MPVLLSPTTDRLTPKVKLAFPEPLVALVIVMNELAELAVQRHSDVVATLIELKSAPIALTSNDFGATLNEQAATAGVGLGSRVGTDVRIALLARRSSQSCL